MDGHSSREVSQERGANNRRRFKKGQLGGILENYCGKCALDALFWVLNMVRK